MDISGAVGPWFRMAAAVIPRFYLYGETARPVDGRFLHVEALDDRSRPSEWTIRPHSHPDLHHVFFIRSGAGAMTADGRVLAFRAPCLLLVPAGSVHGFTYEPESEGVVLTLADAFLRDLLARGPDLDPFALAAVLDAAPAQTEVAAQVQALQREWAWSAPGHAVAVEACMLGLLVIVLRLRLAVEPSPSAALGRQAELVANFRGLLNRPAEALRPLEAYARDLGVPVGRLQRASRAVTGRGPLALVREQRLLAAKRLLAYSTLSVAEVAYSLGIDDAAYFSRLFTKSEGVSPRGYRRRLSDSLSG